MICKHGSKSIRSCKQCHAESMRIFRKTHKMTPEQKMKDNCRSYAGVYKRLGKLKQKPCEICGINDVVMHHDDYSKPLEVRWLCIKHHRSIHFS